MTKTSKKLQTLNCKGGGEQDNEIHSQLRQNYFLYLMEIKNEDKDNLGEN